jgi:hypothetical protein
MREVEIAPEKQATIKDEGKKINLLDISDQPNNMCTKDTDVQELSKVGPYLSKRTDIDTMCPGAAHPGNQHDYATVDTRSGKELVITDIFKKDDVYKALINDKLVQKALNSVHENPKNFEELDALLKSDDGMGIVYVKDNPTKESDLFRLDESVLSEFAFHHLSGDKVAVRMKLNTVGGVDRNCVNELGVLLPTPAALKNDLQAADKHKNGFLMKDSDRFGKKTSTHEEFPDE